MLDPTSAYRTAQVVSASKTGQVVLLYQGAIRFGVQHLAWVERGNVEQAHKSSIRCQEIVSALRESLDLSAGPLAVQLDQLYDFVLRRLMEGNLTKKAKPTDEALQVLRGLLEAWEQLATQPLQPEAASVSAPRVPLTVVDGGLVGAGVYGRSGR